MNYLEVTEAPPITMYDLPVYGETTYIQGDERKSFLHVDALSGAVS